MFIISKLFSWFFLPPGLLILIIVIAILLLIKKKTRAAVILLLITAISFYLLSTTFTKNILLKPLEYYYSYSDIEEIDIDSIIVLAGSSIGRSPDRNMQSALTGGSLIRVYTGFLIWKKKDIPIIVSGGKLFGALEPQSETMKRYLIEFGVPEDKIIEEPKSRNTIENGIYTKEIMNDVGFNKVGLVTSAYHMRRSMLIFRRLGCETIPIPSDYSYNFSYINISMIMPGKQNFRDSCIAIKEYVGLIYTFFILKEIK